MDRANRQSDPLRKLFWSFENGGHLTLCQAGSSRENPASRREAQLELAGNCMQLARDALSVADQVRFKSESFCVSACAKARCGTRPRFEIGRTLGTRARMV
jgi:hypothetical protein